MERADVSEVTPVPDRVPPGFVGLNVLRVKTAGLGRRCVRNQVLVDPDDRVAWCDSEGLGLKTHALDRHRVRLSFGLVTDG